MEQPTNLTGLDLRAEIDRIDDQILALFEQRLAVASVVGRAKDAPSGAHTKLRPDREQAVLARMLSKCQPENAEAVEHLWREIVGWGTAYTAGSTAQVRSPNHAVTVTATGALHHGDGVGALVLLAAALVAEHLCTIRKDDDDDQPGPPSPPEPGLGLSHHD